MKGNTVIVIALAVVVMALISVFIYYSFLNTKEATLNTALNIVTSSAPAFDQSLSDGTITISYPSSEFSLAATQEQLLLLSYIPPCDQGFDYCLYYSTSTYKGTNFESAGIGILNLNKTMPSAGSCLNAPPEGYTGLHPVATTSTPNYSVSMFSPLGNAAMGHYASDVVYRLEYKGKCYQFDARIGETQFANYPPGAIKLFTANDYSTVKSELLDILGTLTLPGGEKVILP
ncbi:MAG: hypothetical protein M1153_01780 [Patescibacteria group bacterium]|nr:hypothetical protein [Patescibacteria group bacterium]